MERKLNNKDQIFVAEYLIDLDPERAALEAGYSKTMAKSKAYQWVSNSKLNSKPYIKAMVDKALAKKVEKAGISAQWVLDNLKEVYTRCMLEDKFDSSGANKSLELLGKHLKLFTDKVEHSGNLTLEAIVAASMREEEPNGQ